MKSKIPSEEKEKIPLLAIYKQDGRLCLRINDQDASIYELYGFLDIYIQDLREELITTVRKEKDEEG